MLIAFGKAREKWDRFRCKKFGISEKDLPELLVSSRDNALAQRSGGERSHLLQLWCQTCPRSKSQISRPVEVCRVPGRQGSPLTKLCGMCCWPLCQGWGPMWKAWPAADPHSWWQWLQEMWGWRICRWLWVQILSFPADFAGQHVHLAKWTSLQLTGWTDKFKPLKLLFVIKLNERVLSGLVLFPSLSGEGGC